MNIKAVFFDIDGTFYDHTTNRVLPSTKEAVRKLKEQGIKIALCSGRPLQLAAELPVFDEFCWDGFIGGSGISVYDENRELIWENAFTEDPAEKAVCDRREARAPLVCEWGENLSDKTTACQERICSGSVSFGRTGNTKLES